MNLLEVFNNKIIQDVKSSLPEFKAGDVLRVHVKITTNTGTRIQIFEGLCIRIRNRSTGSSFTVRKISFGYGVERIFPMYSPNIMKIEVVKRGRVRRAKLYYIRQLRGKKARIKEVIKHNITGKNIIGVTQIAQKTSQHQNSKKI
ncbi:50S ribosomal protein L19 [Lyticum sinuosum]|uniref:Large ribosomal subunit protein bL19 n=1 Tax=Lyticum sinuosum TaxID=1332059 RepID=A0AAE5AHI8_9RICK|nr:50S ribosomal protein L19 [Lyticum sinuosum]